MNTNLKTFPFDGSFFDKHKWLHDFKAELLKEIPIGETLYGESQTEREKGYWMGYLQGLQRTLKGSVPTQIQEMLSGMNPDCVICGNQATDTYQDEPYCKTCLPPGFGTPIQREE